MKLLYNFFKAIFLLIAVSFVFITKGHAQSYGLEFGSHEIVQDKRTSLDLSPGRSFTFNTNFNLSFDLSLAPNMHTYFGYIVRIIEQDKKNIDIIYDNSATAKNHFNIIIGDKLSNINFDIDSNQLFNKWSRMDLAFDYDNDRLAFTINGKHYTAKGLHLQKGSNYKIIFGVNNYKQFVTTDVPPLRLKDIKLYQNGTLQNNWPLNEQNGNIAHDIVNQNDAAVTNPLWILSNHYNWKWVQTLHINSIAESAFDSKKGMLYIVSADSLYCYDVSNDKWTNTHYKSGSINMNIGEQSVFNPYNNTIYNVFPDQQYVAGYSFTDQQWEKKLAPGLITNFSHFNKIFSKSDTSLYLFGGYGQLNYKNEVIQYHLNTGKWETLHTHGDFYMPRYLAGLGSNAKGDTIYIIGGYGSESGRQILNPRNIYEILRFTTKDKSFKKITELDPGIEDFCFANSVIIDEKSMTYTGLIFPQNKYNSTLQLITGKLNSPSYKIVGSAIPYSFHDIHAFADLYYCPPIKKFVAVTFLRSESGKTRVSVYTLLGPPYGNLAKIETRNAKAPWLLFLGLILLAGTGIFFYFYTRNKRTVVVPKLSSALVATHEDINLVDYAAEVRTFVHDNTAIKNRNTYKNSIFFFGDLQIFDPEGVDITKHFTPLIKELFLIIVLYSIRNGRGVSPEKLNEIFWYDKSEKDARNNRSVSLTKLKSLLDKLGGHYHLSRDTGYWMIDIDFSNIYVDYFTYAEIIRDKKMLDIERVKLLSEIVKRGNFLSNIEYEWLDSFKSEISNDVTNNLLHFLQYGNQSNDPELVIEIVNFIFYFDPLNEEAMTIKCKTLSALGKHSLAHYTFETFIKEYRNLYGEEFKKDFHAVTG